MFWRAHVHSPNHARCSEPGCDRMSAGFAIRGMSPLCGAHLVQRRRRGHEIRFVDGGICNLCGGYGQIELPDPAAGESPGSRWERCSLCRGSGYLDEDVLDFERRRLEDEQLSEYRRRSELRREIEEGVARRRAEEEELNERRRAEIERARQYEENRLRALAGQSPVGDGPGEGGDDDGSAGGGDDGGEAGDGRRHRRGRCRTIALALLIVGLVSTVGIGGAAALYFVGFGGELPQATPTPAEATATPTPLPTPTPTATPVPPTATPTPTATPQPTPTPTATPRPTATPTPMPTATPTLLPPTAAPTATPLPVPTATPTPLPARSGAGRDPATDTPGPFGPVEGHLHHDADEYIEERGAGILRGDFVASVEFHNPYPGVVRGWDYGFLFRDAGQHEFHAVIVENTSGTSGMWFHYLRDGEGEGRLVDSGEAAGLWLGSEGVNDLRLVALGEQGWLYLNDNMIGMLDLSDGPAKGNIGVITGYRDGNEVPGQTTRFRDFTVHEPQPIGDRSGTLDRTEDGFIDRALLRGSPRDFIATATFTNPNAGSAGRWDYGFTFRGSGPDSYHAVYVDSERQWNHALRTGGSGASSGMSGRAFSVDTRADAQNTLLLVVVGETGLLYVNGDLLPNLDLHESVTNGAVGIASGFEGPRLPGQQTQYEDFRAWSLDAPSP